jgi:L-lactate dehydrogenase complex protein LldG
MALNPREQIIQDIRRALIHPSDPPAKVRSAALPQEDPFDRGDEDPALRFARRLLALNGQFVYAESREELAKYLQQAGDAVAPHRRFCLEPALQELLGACRFECRTSTSEWDRMELGISSCEALIAWSGSVVVSSAQNFGRTMTVYPPVHWVIARSSQLVETLGDALLLIQDRYRTTGLPSMISTITGPSRTADIEKTLVLGAHGPREFWVFLLEDSAE